MEKIKIENATVVRGGRTVLENISISVQPGECIAIYGPNGAGKTTLLNLVNGLVFPSTGNVFVGDTPVNKKTACSIRLITGYVPQNFDVDPKIPVLTGTVVLSGCYGKIGLFRYPDFQMIEKAKKIMEQLEIFHIFDRPFGQISGGERQKTMIARAIFQEPDIFLLDEPFSSISESSKEKIINVIKNWQKEKNWTILLVAHESGIIEKMCNRVYYIDEGRIVFQENLYGNL